MAELKRLKIILKRYNLTLYSNYNFLIPKLIYNGAYIIIIIINLIIVNNIIGKSEIILQLLFIGGFFLFIYYIDFY